MGSQIEDLIDKAYEFLPPPLSALPAKYHAPISLFIHSLSTGYIASRLAELSDYYDYIELAFLLGVTHDIHQKLVEDKLSTLKTSKEYVRGKLDELDFTEYYRFIDDALEVDACGKKVWIRDLPKEVATMCHIGDMAQGRIEGLSLLLWLRDQVKEINPDLTVRFYSTLIPQPFARTYIMQRIYRKYIADKEQLSLASPWGLYVITYEDELPEVLEISWDDLRIDSIIDYDLIKEIEEKKRTSKEANVNVTKDEIRYKMWSKLARMFYKQEYLGGDPPIYPVLPLEYANLFMNIEFTDIKFSKPEGNTHVCPLCGVAHLESYSFGVNMYKKLSSINVTTEKWTRKLVSTINVRGWSGQWRHGYGLDPICALDALAIRHLISSIWLNGLVSISMQKPIPVDILNWVSMLLQMRKDKTVKISIIPKQLEKVVVDYGTATALSISNNRPSTDGLFSGELSSIGWLIEHGIYPVKYLESIDTSTPDRLLVTTHTFTLIDFPVTGKEYGKYVPWVASLLRIAGEQEKTEGLKILSAKPHHAPLLLLSLNKEVYLHISELMSNIGVKV